VVAKKTKLSVNRKPIVSFLRFAEIKKSLAELNQQATLFY